MTRTIRPQKRPKKGPFRRQPNGNPIERLSPSKTRKNGTCEDTRARETKTRHASLFSPRGVIDGLARRFCAHEDYSPPSFRMAWGVRFWGYVR